MELQPAHPMTRPKLAVVIAASLAVFAATCAVAETDYAGWMWLLVMAGLILPWVAAAAVAAFMRDRLARR